MQTLIRIRRFPEQNGLMMKIHATARFRRSGPQVSRGNLNGEKQHSTLDQLRKVGSLMLCEHKRHEQIMHADFDMICLC